MSKRLIGLMAGLLLIAALAIVGCGDSDEEATASSITKAEFVKKANATCKAAEEQIQGDFGAYAVEIGELKNPTESDYAKLIEVVLVPNLEEEIEKLRELGAPSGDESEVDAMIEAREESIELAEEDPRLVVDKGEAIFGKSSQLAEEYGLEACAAR